MYSPLFWIEWLDRIDRVMRSARQDVAASARGVSVRSREALQRSKRQLAVLTGDLRLMDTAIISGGSAASSNAAEDLQAALDAAVLQLEALAELASGSAYAVRDRALAAADAALRDAIFEAAMLLAPKRRRA